MNEAVLLTKRGKPRKKMGRPKKDKGGKNLWIPAELLDTVQALLEQYRLQQSHSEQSNESSDAAARERGDIVSYIIFSLKNDLRKSVLFEAIHVNSTCACYLLWCALLF